MSYKDKPQIKLYTFTNNSFVQQAIIDDFQEISFSHNLYEAGDFTISINYNIPNALKFERGLFVQFGDNPYMFGEILKITDAIGEDGKGSQIRTITGKDARYIFKRRIIKNLNNVENWIMTDKGELCLRNLIKDQCGSGAESKRQLPIINTIPASADAIGKEYSVAESFSNLYDTLVTIATQSEIGWRVKFNGSLTLECYEGSDLSDSVQFSTDFDSLSNGQFTDSAEAYANSIYVGGKGTGAERDIYEGESAIGGSSPSGFDRYEAWDNQSSMTSESEYEAEALSMLNQYGQTVTIDGQGLAKCPYEFQQQYNIGDVITLAFSGKSAKAQILSVTEHWIFGQYGIEFTFGKPQNDFSRQMQLILKQIQKASVKTTVTESVKWYTMTSNQTQDKADVIYDSIGFTGAIGTGKTFTFYWDSEKTGAKTYNIYGKALSGTGKLTLKSSATNKATITLETGTYVASVYVDADGNVVLQSCTATSSVSSGNSQPVTSGGVAEAIDNSAYNTKYGANGAESLDSVGWYKIAELGQRNRGLSIIIDLGRGYFYSASEVHHIVLEYGWVGIDMFECSSAITPLFDKIRLCYNNNNTDKMGIYVHYTGTQENPSYFSISGLVSRGLQDTSNIEVFNFVPDSLTWDNTKEYVLRGSGLYFNGDRLTPISTIVSGSTAPVTSGGVASYYGANKKFISWNSASIYSSGYILLAEISHKTGGNHDVGFSGIAQICPAGTITNAYFQGFIRAGGGSVNIKQFTINYLGGGKYLYLSCFYEVTDTNNIIIRLYGNVATWLKYNVYFDSLLAGDVAEPVNPAVSNVTFPLTVTNTRAGTEIPVTVYNP